MNIYFQYIYINLLILLIFRNFSEVDPIDESDDQRNSLIDNEMKLDCNPIDVLDEVPATDTDLSECLIETDEEGKSTENVQTELVDTFEETIAGEIDDREIPTSPIDENNNIVNVDISKRNFKVTLRMFFLISRLV